jgi:CheY-like chemotaxis protein/anti-sigma regulatory factor (Ser/Thr protein kinase)
MENFSKESKCILVVDDEEEMRGMIVDYLELEGYTVLAASSGREALDVYLPANKIDLVLSDINMPAMKGFELLKEVRESYPHIKRVLITAFNVEDYLELAMKHDVGNIFVKSTPFNFQELSTILESLISGDIFGVSRYFDKPVLERNFSIRKGNKLDVYAHEIVSCLPNVANARKIELVLIEILANAVFYGIRKEKADNKAAWAYDFELAETEAPCVTLVADEEKFGISVIDKGGKLSKHDVLYWLNRQVTCNEAGLPLGAYDCHGRGLYIAREYIDRLIINIDRDRRTEVIVIKYYTHNFSGYKSLHINEI